MGKIECPRIGECRLFPLLRGEGFLDVWKSDYCIGKFPQCVRYQMFLRKEKVPDDLLPNGKTLPRI